MTTYMKLSDGLTEEVMKKAERELGETPEIRKNALEELRYLIDNEHGFEPLNEDSFLLMFLRNKKYDIRRAFRTLKNFYDFKSMYSGTVTDMRLIHVKKILEMGGILVSPLRNTDGEAVAVITSDVLDYKKATAYEILGGGLTVGEMVLCQEVTQICGVTLVYDFKDLSFRDLMGFATPSFLSLHARVFQNTYPYRLKAIHVVNQPSYFSIVFNLMKVFLSRKIRDRVFIHGDNLDALFEHVPRDILPKKVGGDLSDDIYEEFRSNIYKNESLVEMLTKYTYNEVPYGGTSSSSDDSS